MDSGIVESENLSKNSRIQANEWAKKIERITKNNENCGLEGEYKRGRKREKVDLKNIDWEYSKNSSERISLYKEENIIKR